MIKKYVRAISGLLVLLVAATACALPASPPETGAAAIDAATVALVAAEVAATEAVETATTASLPTVAEPAAAATEPAVAAPQPADPTPLVVDAPEKETPVAEPQPVDGMVGPTDEQQWVLDGLPSLGQAPELRNDVWLNSEPLRLADLRGQVVLLDMWTFG